MLNKQKYYYHKISMNNYIILHRKLLLFWNIVFLDILFKSLTEQYVLIQILQKRNYGYSHVKTSINLKSVSPCEFFHIDDFASKHHNSFFSKINFIVRVNKNFRSA